VLDIKQIRETPEEVKTALARRGKDYSAEIDQILALDEQRRALLQKTEALKAEQNAASKKIPAMKKDGEDVTEIMAQMKEIAQKLPAMDEALRETTQNMEPLLLSLPNIPKADVPDGKGADDNLEINRWGKQPQFGFAPKPHWEIGGALGILDPATAAKVTGARFHFYKGLGARLERSVFNFFMDTHSARGYTEILPPYMVNRAAMTGTGQLPKFEDGSFKIQDTDYFLIPTAEVPVTNMHREEILDAESLPIRYCAYSANFRSEAGAAGRDTRGLIRQHQFNKVELVVFSRPENSYSELVTLTEDAEYVLKVLGLPYRVVTQCTGDMGACSAQTNDLEVWMPSYERYVEISSCSNFEGYQARRAKIRYRGPEDGKPHFLHTLNGSGLAVGRTVAAILENFQNKDGSVTVPKALRPYMGTDVIK